MHATGEIEEGIWKDGEMVPEDGNSKKTYRDGGIVSKDVLVDPNTPT